MHAEDESLGKNQIAEVFQKGYKKGSKVLRYSMVKVVN
ncbi:Protein GrpE [bioreactor metagenome]